MKRAIALGVLGLAASVVSTLGVGSIFFDSYLSSTSTTFVNFNNGAVVKPFPAGFTAALVYSLTPITDPAGSIFDTTLLPGWSPAYQSPDSSNPGNGLMTAAIFVGVDGGAYFTGSGHNSVFVLPTYTGDAPVYFEVIAYNGSSYAASFSRGHSAAWGQSLTTGTTVPQDIAFPAFSVYGVIPEPTTLAFGGLSLAALFLFRRQQA